MKLLLQLPCKEVAPYQAFGVAWKLVNRYIWNKSYCQVKVPGLIGTGLFLVCIGQLFLWLKVSTVQVKSLWLDCTDK